MHSHWTFGKFALAMLCGSGASATVNEQTCSSTEGANQAFDGYFGTKWCGYGVDYPSPNKPRTVTYDFAGTTTQVVSAYAVISASCSCTSVWCATTSNTSPAMGKGGALYGGNPPPEALMTWITVAGNGASQARARRPFGLEQFPFPCVHPDAADARAEVEAVGGILGDAVGEHDGAGGGANQGLLRIGREVVDLGPGEDMLGFLLAPVEIIPQEDPSAPTLVAGAAREEILEEGGQQVDGPKKYPNFVVFVPSYSKKTPLFFTYHPG